VGDVGLVDEQPVEHVRDFEVFFPHRQIGPFLEARNLGEALVLWRADVAAESPVGQMKSIKGCSRVFGRRVRMQVKDARVVAELAGVHVRPCDGVPSSHDLHVVMPARAGGRFSLLMEGFGADLRFDPVLYDGELVGEQGIRRPHPRPGLGAPRPAHGPGGFVEAAFRHFIGIQQDIVLDPIVLAGFRLSIGECVGA